MVPSYYFYNLFAYSMDDYTQKHMKNRYFHTENLYK